MTVGVGAFVAITFVSSSPPSILIRFHYIELRATVSANICGIAVLERIAVVRRIWHHNGIKGSETATFTVAQVNIKFNGASEELWFEVGRGIQSRRS